MITLQTLLEWGKGKWQLRSEVGEATEVESRMSAEVEIKRLANLSDSKPGDLTFLTSSGYLSELDSARPAVLLTSEKLYLELRLKFPKFFEYSRVVVASDAYAAMAVITEKVAVYFSSIHAGAQSHDSSAIIHAQATVHPSAQIAAGARVGPYCVIEENVKIDSGTVLYAGCFVGPHVKIGKDCVLFPKVTVYEKSEIGNRVRIHAGAVIGADGFGYAPRFEEGKIKGHHKIFHLGQVLIGDDVEIGANACIDRGTFGSTRLANQVKIDNLVQIGHNVEIGEGTVICGSSAIAGSAKIGRYVYIGGHSGVSNQVEVGDGSRVAAMTVVSKNLSAGGTAVGFPQRDQHDHFRLHALLNKMLRLQSKGSAKGKSDE